MAPDGNVQFLQRLALRDVAAASLATFASPSAVDRLMSAIMNLSTALRFQLLRRWIASSVEKPTFLTVSTDFFAGSSARPCVLARATIDMPILLVCAAWFAASMVHSFAHSRAFLIDSAISLPAAAPFDHAGPHAVDSGGCAMRGLRCCLLHAGQSGVDALDRSVRLVDVHLDDEFDLIVVGGHERLI